MATLQGIVEFVYGYAKLRTGSEDFFAQGNNQQLVTIENPANSYELPAKEKDVLTGKQAMTLKYFATRNRLPEYPV